MLKFFSILSSTLLVAACTSGPLIGIYPQVLLQDITSLYYPQSVSVFGGAGGPTEVYGSPIGGGTAEEVVADLYLPSYVASRSLKAVEPGAGGIRLILVFAPQTTALAGAACKGQAKAGEAGSQMKVFGVFCRGSRAMSEAVVYAEGSPRVHDPAMAGTLNRLIVSLMPAVDPNNDNNERPNRINP
jgi:hypothetical protein